jgi:hypothetical protein
MDPEPRPYDLASVVAAEFQQHPLQLRILALIFDQYLECLPSNNISEDFNYPRKDGDLCF